jgi:repressor of nif and glnA expression
MSDLLVEGAIDTIKKLTAGFSTEQKADLLSRLPVALGVVSVSPGEAPGQVQTTSVSGVSQTGAGGNVFNLSPVQAGGDANVNQTIQQTHNPDLQQAVNVLEHLKAQIEQTSALDPLQKSGAKAQVEQLATELKKDEPDKNLVKHTIATLKQDYGFVE